MTDLRSVRLFQRLRHGFQSLGAALLTVIIPCWLFEIDPDAHPVTWLVLAALWLFYARVMPSKPSSDDEIVVSIDD